ncbi:MAG: AbrB/MazE/SpoVT family DNA-binding domain-containing protein [Candidatus Zhuqueibacterota bacterium]
MESVTISPEFQIVIPRRVGDSLKLKPGQKIRVIQFGKRIELIPEVEISEMRGFLKGIDTKISREEER